MATDNMLQDVGAIYNRLFNHRGYLQSTYQYFVKEFEGRRGDSDRQSLDDCERMNEVIQIDHLPGVFQESPLLDTVLLKTNELTSKCENLIKEGQTLLNMKLAEEDLETLTRDLKGYTEKIDTGRQQLSDKHKEDMTTLQKELEEVQAQIKKVQGKLDAPPVLS